MPITLTSRYKPLTYDEITRPLIEQTQAQEVLENAYMEAQDQAAQLMAQANEQTDHDSYVKLKNYANAIQQQADVLMQQGLNRNSRQSLLNLRRRYTQDIVPVANAAKRRQELYDERHKLRLTHPDMLQENEVISLDDLVRNPNMDLGATLYGSDLTKRAATLTNALARGKQSIALGQNLDKYTQTVLSQFGFTPEEIQAALTGNETPESVALRKLYSSTGVDNWKNAAAKQAVWDYIAEGAMQGVGDFKISTQADHNTIRREQLADRAEERKFQAALYGMTQDEEGNWIYDPNHPGPRSRQPKLNSNGTVAGLTTQDIVEVGPYNSNYKGNICKTKNGNYVIRTKDGYLPVSAEAAERSNAGVNMLLMSPILFKGDSAKGGSSGQFNPKDAEEISWKDLTSEQKGYINRRIASIGLKPEEITIYKDSDWGRDDYKVVPKGYDAYGNPPEYEEILDFDN